MPKRKPREVTPFEKELVALIETAAPGRVVLAQSKPVFANKKPGYELEIATRGTTTTYLNQDLEDSIQVALYDLKSGEADPVRPAWARVSRHHREVVIRTLQEIEARHMSRAAKAKLGTKHSARAEYEIADAFHAALEQLWIADDYDERGELLPGTPKLEDDGPPEPIHVVKPRAPKRARP